MNTPEHLLHLSAPDAETQQRLLQVAQETLSGLEDWLQPFGDAEPAGEDPAYEDDFLWMREEINKTSGGDLPQLCLRAGSFLCHTAKDIRVATWYTLARLQDEGLRGLSEGLLLLSGLVSRFGAQLHPQRANARRASLEWLNSERIIDSLGRFPGVVAEDTATVAMALVQLHQSVSQWPEAERPVFTGLCQALRVQLERAGGAGAMLPQNASPQGASPAPQPFSGGAVPGKLSARDVLDQARQLSRWLGEQPSGWLAAHRLMKTVRWDTVEQLPPLAADGTTRLNPPRADYRAQLIRLYRQQSWSALVTLADQFFAEGVNHFWLDLQWYLWQGLSKAGEHPEVIAEAVLADLRLFLTRLPGIETLAWNDGSPFADEVTLHWIAERVNASSGHPGHEPAATMVAVDEDIQTLEAEATAKGDSDGPEAALAWLQTRPGFETPRGRWLVRLLMARVAEQYGRNDMAMHLLGELAAQAPQLTLADWEPGLLFEVLARRLKLLRLRAGRHDSERARLAPEMDSLLASLVNLDPARAMVLCS
ncbi:type VI secretion system protein TssA [Enterobacter roggenkampii]